MRTGAFILALAGGMLFGAPARADIVHLENHRGQKLILCVYRSDSRELLRSRDCWSLDHNETARWNRGDALYEFDVRLFEQGLFELPICMRRRFGEVYRLVALPRSDENCVRGDSRDVVKPGTFEKGDRVLANIAGDNWWYPGIVDRTGQARHPVRLVKGQTISIAPHFITGDDLGTGRVVEINWKGQGRWYPAKILGRAADSFEVEYEDGSRETAILPYVRTRVRSATSTKTDALAITPQDER